MRPSDEYTPFTEDMQAYFLTWTTYGAWLPGDERGWVEKPGRSRAPDSDLQAECRSRMTETRLLLSLDQRTIVESWIAEVCDHSGWHLHAVSCRGNHVHVVVSATEHQPEMAATRFNAWCTRRLKERDSSESKRLKWWTQGSSTKWLRGSQSVQNAVGYVLESQDRKGIEEPIRKMSPGSLTGNIADASGWQDAKSCFDDQ